MRHQTLTLDHGWCVTFCSRIRYCWPCWQMSHDCHAHIACRVCRFKRWYELTSMYITFSPWMLTRLKQGVIGCLARFARCIVNLKAFDCQRMMLQLFQVVCVWLSESPITVLRLALCSSYHTTDTLPQAPWHWLLTFWVRWSWQWPCRHAVAMLKQHMFCFARVNASDVMCAPWSCWNAQ